MFGIIWTVRNWKVDWIKNKLKEACFDNAA